MPGAAGLTHNMVSDVADSLDTEEVQPTDWNDKHYFAGGNLGALLYQGTSGEVQQVNSVASGQVLTSAGAGSVPAWSANPAVTSLTLGTSGILQGGTNLIEQRNSTSAQTLRIYRTFTDTSNYTRFKISSDATFFHVGTEYAGTGTEKGIVFMTSNVDRWKIDGSTGHLVAYLDNTYDIGATGERPRNGYFAGTLSFGTRSALGAETLSGFITITDSGGTTRKLAVIS